MTKGGREGRGGEGRGGEGRGREEGMISRRELSIYTIAVCCLFVFVLVWFVGWFFWLFWCGV